VPLTIGAKRRQSRSITLTVRGLLDLAGAARLRSAISTAIAERPREIVIDLVAVERLDAVAVGTLVVADRICRELEIGFTVRSRPSEGAAPLPAERTAHR
jgi:anti-anti-sigma factor